MSTSHEIKNEGHGHDEATTIIVNGREKEVNEKELTFADLVSLSGLPTGPTIIFTVTFRRGEGNKEGSLVEGESVKIKDGMIFNVTSTDKS